MATVTMQLFYVANTSSEWWVIAPDMETAIDYSYDHSRTLEKKNLFAQRENESYYYYHKKTGLKELLECEEIGFVQQIEFADYPHRRWRFVDRERNLSIERYVRQKQTKIRFSDLY